MAYNSTNEYLKILNELGAYHIPKNITDSLSGYLKSIYRSELENRFSAPMLWIGLYIALASLVCILAMVADLLHGLHSRKLWFPCKYFRINSAFLTVISVAMKLPMDLTGSMPGIVDQVAKLGSMAFMCTMMANLLPCFATMDNNDLYSNIAALFVLVITMVVNVWIQIQTGVVSTLTYNKDPRITTLVSPKRNVISLPFSIENCTILHFIYVTLLLVLLIVHVCSCLAVLKSQNIIELKYQQGQYKASKDIQQPSGSILAVEKLHKLVANHWIMVGSGNSQFIFTACFQTTSASGVICVFVTILHTVTMSSNIEAMLAKDYDSDYGWSMILIVIVQFIGVVIGAVVPLSRCFAAFISFKVMSFKIMSDHFKVFEVERYWTGKLYDWKHDSIRLPFRSHKLKVVIQTIKKLILGFCIEFQEGVVVVCKTIALIPFSFMICVLYCLKRVKGAVFSSLGHMTDIFERNEEPSQYVLQLKDEMVLAERTLESLLKSVEQLIQKGEKSHPENITKLIVNRSTRGFHGVEKFDRCDHSVPSLALAFHYQDCWRLPVVTLTTIAISLPRIEKNEVESLLRSVREGLVYVTIVEKSLNVTYDRVRTQNAAQTLWQEVDVAHKWLGNKLRDLSSQVNTVGQTVKWFKDKAEDICYMMHRSKGNTTEDENYDYICAYSMYRITKTILHTYHASIDDMVNPQVLFNDLSSMIADIIAACLTNLPRVITMKCHTSVIEKREARLKVAAQLLGETAKIITILENHEIPNMDPDDMAYINCWRAYLQNP